MNRAHVLEQTPPAMAGGGVMRERPLVPAGGVAELSGLIDPAWIEQALTAMQTERCGGYGKADEYEQIIQDRLRPFMNKYAGTPESKSASGSRQEHRNASK